MHTPDFNNPNAWFDTAPNNEGWIVIDPSTGLQINPNEVPQYITEDPDLGRGIAFLTERVSQTEITIGYGEHDEANDLGDPSVRRFEDRVDAADFYAYEFAWDGASDAHDQLVQKVRNDLKEAYGTDDVSLEELSRFLRTDDVETDFFARLMRTFLRTSTKCFSHDMALQNGSDFEGRLVDAYSQIFSRDDNTSLFTASGLNNAREWVMVARTGLNLSLSEAKYDEGSSIDVFKTAGVGHLDLSRKYSILGVTVQEKFIQPYPEDSGRAVGRTGNDLGRVMATGVFSHSDLPILLGLDAAFYDS